MRHGRLPGPAIRFLPPADILPGTARKNTGPYGTSSLFPASELRPNKHRSAFFSGLLVFSLIVALVDWLYGIRFETNDDVAMMMMNHGFGVAAQATPMILFSNIWQGSIIEALGWPFGRPAYGLYMMGMLVVALAATMAFLCELNRRFWMNALVVLAIAIRPVFSPQFTVVAGYLAIAAFLALAAHMARPRASLLLAACGLALAAFLMRDYLLLMMGLVGAPFLLRRPLLRGGRAWARRSRLGAAGPRTARRRLGGARMGRLRRAKSAPRPVYRFPVGLARPSKPGGHARCGLERE